MESTDQIVSQTRFYAILVCVVSNGLVVILATIFTMHLLFGVIKARKKIYDINNLGFYSHSQNEKIIHLRTSLYRNWILIIVVIDQGLQSTLFIISAAFEHFRRGILTQKLHLDLQCTYPNNNSLPFIASNNPITSSIDGMFYSSNCLFLLFLSILMSYFVKIYNAQINPVLLSYNREYFLAVFGILQFVTVWVLFSVPYIGRAGGFVAAIFIVLNFFILLAFVHRLRVSINNVRQTSFGQVYAKYTIVYREYLCISFTFMCSIMIYTIGVLLSIVVQWYFVVLNFVEQIGCRWLVGIFYNVEHIPNFTFNSELKIPFQALSIVFLLTTFQFNVVVIFLTFMHVISGWVKKCRRVVAEERPIMLEAETSLASSEYTLSDNPTSVSISNNGSRNSATML